MVAGSLGCVCLETLGAVPRTGHFAPARLNVFRPALCDHRQRRDGQKKNMIMIMIMMMMMMIIIIIIIIIIIMLGSRLKGSHLYRNNGTCLSQPTGNVT